MAEVPASEEQPMAIDHSLVDADAEVAESEAGTVLDDKITILKGHSPDMSAATFCLAEEDHTLGNSLRYMLMKDPQVEFCGYSNPHPSEPKIHLRVQMYDGASALSAVRQALSNLEDLFLSIESAYSVSLDAGKYDRSEEIGTSAQELRDIVARGNEIRQAQLDEERAKKTAV